MKQRHHDGHGLNDLVVVDCDERDPDAGNASHRYTFFLCGAQVAHVQFQHGPRNVPASRPGVLDEAVLAMLLDRFEGFLEGPFACAETQETFDHLSAAMASVKKRANDRAARRVLGTNEQ